MMLEFVKMNGAGNDFVLIDNRAGKIRLTTEQIVRLCHRHRGIGADGLFLLVPNTSGKAEWSWEFYNSDGSIADMCGNGARCFARFVQRVAGAMDHCGYRTARRSPDCRLGECQSCRADASCAPAARARPSADW
jgi:diaminopimelate epimerase